MDFFNGLVAIDYHHTHRLAGGDFAVFVEDATIKGVAFALEAAFIDGPGTAIATAGAFERCLEIGKQQDGEVGLQASAHRLVEGEDNLAPEFAPSALVGLGR